MFLHFTHSGKQNEIFGECHNYKSQPIPEIRRKKKETQTNTRKANKHTKSTQTSSLFPKRGNRNVKGTANTRTKHKARLYIYRLVELTKKLHRRRATPGPQGLCCWGDFFCIMTTSCGENKGSRFAIFTLSIVVVDVVCDYGSCLVFHIFDGYFFLNCKQYQVFENSFCMFAEKLNEVREDADITQIEETRFGVKEVNSLLMQYCFCFVRELLTVTLF